MTDVKWQPCHYRRKSSANRGYKVQSISGPMTS
jgi:hypothetical protein